MLKVQHLHTYYGESHILQGVDLSVTTAQCVAVLGRNGAGKTTTLRSILGLTPARRGLVEFNGIDITRLPTHKIVRSGIAFVPEDRGIFPTVTVEEHLAIAYGASKHRPKRRPLEYVFEIFPRLAERRRSLGGQLSGGEQQMLAMGRALMSQPRLLMLDEPSLGLAPLIVADIFRTIGELRQAGVSVLLVEQNARAALEIADRAYVMELGEFIMSGSAKEISGDQRVVASYLGFQHGEESRL